MRAIHIRMAEKGEPAIFPIDEAGGLVLSNVLGDKTFIAFKVVRQTHEVDKDGVTTNTIDAIQQAINTELPPPPPSTDPETSTPTRKDDRP